MISRRREQGRTESMGHRPCCQPAARCAAPQPAALRALVDVLDHHDRDVHHGAERDGDAAEHMMLALIPCVHDDEGREDAHRQREHHHQRRAQVEQEHGQTSATT